MNIAMRKYWTEWVAVFVVFAMLQGHAVIGRALGEAWIPEETGGYETVAVEDTEASDMSVGLELADRPMRQRSYVFRPKVCSAYMEEVFGKTMCETWYHLVDAVMAGEDTFACPDQHTYDWVMGQFPIRCFPVLTELIDFAHDRENSVVDGIASFIYLVPREEAAGRIREFARQVESILNDVLEDDYSDFEKALVLYDYFSHTYHYDYETEQKMYDTFVDYTTTCRLFEQGTDNFAPITWISVTHEDGDGYLLVISMFGTKMTKRNVLRTGIFSANLVSTEMLPLMDYFGSHHAADGKKNGMEYSVSRGQVLDVPVLDQSPWVYECEVSQKLDTGDSTTFFCPIRNIQMDERLICKDSFDVDLTVLDPVIYSGKYHSLGKVLGNIGDYL